MYPVLWEPFGFPISSFGVMVALGFLVAGSVAARGFEALGLSRDAAWNVLIWCLVGGLLGAKLWYVGEQIARYPDAPVLELLLSRGGLTWYGGFVGGALLGLLGARRNQVPLKSGLDAASPAIAWGQAVGRIGCFLVGDDYGVPSDVPWAVAFPQGLPPTELPVHPTMLYETAWLGIGGLWLWSRRGRSPFLFGEYLILAGVGRAIIEHWRVNPAALGALTNAQLVAAACIAIGAGGWLYWSRRARLSPQRAR